MGWSVMEVDMTSEDLKKAEELNDRIIGITDTINVITDEDNYDGIPEGMFQRHKAEKLGWLCAEQKRLEEEFERL